MDRKRTKHAELPDELVEAEILSRLPIKSIFRFTAVCSKWRDTIKNPHFAKLQHSHSKNHDIVLLRQDHSDGSSDFFAGGRKVVPPIPGKDYRVYSSNGVLLLVDYPTKLFKKRRTTGYTRGVMKLWNPTTGKSRDIPNPPGFDSELPRLCAFRLDPNSGGFRIFIMMIKKTDTDILRVFSSDSKTWITLKIPQLDSSIVKSEKSHIVARAFIHGGFHFLGDVFPRRILSLSPAGEIIAGFQPPPRVMKSTFIFNTGVWNGRLCLRGLSPDRRHLRVWAMEEYGDNDSWKLVWSVPIVFPMNLPLHHPPSSTLAVSNVCLVTEPTFLQPCDDVVPLSMIQNCIRPLYVLRNAGRMHQDLDCNIMVKVLSPQEISEMPNLLEMSNMLCVDIYSESLFDPNP